METNAAASLTALRDWLSQVAPGEITDTSEAERLLALAWNELVSDDGGMNPEKLFGRMENVVWTPPNLTFSIERHGWTACGSSRAEMQTWTVNVQKGTACCETAGYRQVSPRQRPLDVKPLAEEVASLILEHAEDARVKWQGEDAVRVNIGVILPEKSAVKETLAKRRKRFRAALAERLARHGWVQIRANRYKLNEKAQSNLGD
jgi:hypothetical protein